MKRPGQKPGRFALFMRVDALGSGAYSFFS